MVALPTPGDLPYPGIELLPLSSLGLAGKVFTTRATWEAPFFLEQFLKLAGRVKRPNKRNKHSTEDNNAFSTESL